MQRSNTFDASQRAGLGLTRGVWRGGNDETLWQEGDVDLYWGERRTRVERIQNYGFTSVPMPPSSEGGRQRHAEVITGSLTGSRSHQMILAVDDRRHRRRGMQPGEVAMYGQRAQNGDQNYVHIYGDRIEISVPAGKHVVVKVGETELKVEDGKISGKTGNNDAYFVAKKGKCVQMKKKGTPALHITVDLENNRLVQGSTPVIANDPFPNE